MYHRILPADDPRAQEEEPGMVVTPTTFRRHIQWLKSEFEIIHLTDWIDRQTSGRALPPKACAITFDDGWRDNYEFAFPILQETASPATIFAVSHMTGTDETFWPNRLSSILRLPDALRSSSPHLKCLRAFIQPHSGTPLTRDHIAAIISRIKTLPDSEILSRLDQIEEALGLQPFSYRSLLNWEELDKMCQTGLVQIGSHTRYHTRLNGALSPETTAHEIIDSQKLLQDRLGRPVRLFCYPNGEWTSYAATLVRQYYDGAVTTRSGINTPGGLSCYELMRTAVHEDISNRQSGLFARLSGWL